MRQNLLEEFGVPIKKTTIIRNPTDIKRLRYLAGKATKPEFDERKITFVSVGALEIWKNFDGLIRAISLCKNDQICLKIIGEGSERNKLETLIDQLGLSSRVTLLGHVDNPCPLIFESDALVLTSIYEGLPNVILEALALKTSVIATPAGGVCEELLADRYGCFVAKDHSDTSIVDAIVDWSKNAPYQIDDNAVLSFDAQHVVQTFENLFMSVRR